MLLGSSCRIVELHDIYIYIWYRLSTLHGLKTFAAKEAQYNILVYLLYNFSFIFFKRYWNCWQNQESGIFCFLLFFLSPSCLLYVSFALLVVTIECQSHEIWIVLISPPPLHLLSSTNLPQWQNLIRFPWLLSSPIRSVAIAILPVSSIVSSSFLWKC